MKTDVTDVLAAANASSPRSIAQQQELKKLEHIKHSEHKLKQLQSELSKLIDSITQNPSMLSRTATFWGNLSLWKKIVLGATILTPPLVLGILTQFIACYIITALLLTIYVCGSIALDDHSNHTRLGTEHIKTGISSLATSLSAIISLLEQLGEQLAEQVARFSKENDDFEAHLKELNEQNQHLNTEINSLQSIEHQLDSTEHSLALLCQKLQEQVVVQSNLTEITQNELQKIRQKLEAVFIELKGQTVQLNETQKQLQQTTVDYETQANKLTLMIKQLEKITIAKTKAATIENSIIHTHNQDAYNPTLFKHARINQLQEQIIQARETNNLLRTIHCI